MIQYLLIQISHKRLIVCSIFFFSGYMIKNRGSIQRFCQSPVHPVMYHRMSFPVCSIYDPRCTIGCPSICHCLIVQFLCCQDIRLCSCLVLFICRKCPLGNQPCPFDPMPWGGTIGLKLIIRSFFIAFQIRLPVTGKMLRDPPTVIFCPANYMVDNTACPCTVFSIAHCICDCQKSFHCMHICIYASVRIQLRKLCIPGIAGKTLFLIPETVIIYIQCVFQQFLCAISSRQDPGCSCQNHKCMRIALLRRNNFTTACKSCIPAAIYIVMKFSLKTL